MHGTRCMEGATSRGRHLSPALSDCSDLSMLSRSPSPPPGLLQKLALPPATPSPPATPTKLRERGPNGRFMPRNAKRSASPSFATRSSVSKKPRTSPKSPVNVATLEEARDSARGSRSLRSAQTSRRPAKAKRTAGTDPPAATTDASGSGDLNRLPKEVRQQIYGYCLQVDEPVCVKECCGPHSTRRERASCKKHGDRCVKIGLDNGVTPYDGGTRKTHGRFNILGVSRAVKEDASWVLHTKGSLLIKSTPELEAYVSENDIPQKRLPSLPEPAKHMWMAAACFRNVCFQLPWTMSSMDDPVEFANRLYEVVALLMKAWELQTKPISSRSRTVSVQLQCLYTAIIPFNASASDKMAFHWTAFHDSSLPSGLIANFEIIGKTVATIVERLVDTVGRHGGSSQWKVIAQAPRGCDKNESEQESEAQEDEENEGVLQIRALEQHCHSNGIDFETTA